MSSDQIGALTTGQLAALTSAAVVGHTLHWRVKRFHDGKVYAIDVAQRQVIAEIPAGQYPNGIAVHPDGDVDEVGVDASLRGRGVAPALYHRAGEAMARSGVPRLRAMLASTNTATLRLHAKLGFQESARRTVFALDLAPAGREV